MPIVITIVGLLIVLYIGTKITDEWTNSDTADTICCLLFRWTHNKPTTTIIVAILLVFRIVYEIGGLFACAAV